MYVILRVRAEVPSVLDLWHAAREMGGYRRELCRNQGLEIVEEHAMPNHIHLCLSSPPKVSVANTVKFAKGKSAIHIHRRFPGQKRNFWGCTSGHVATA
jgi:REP element-mobilizing transposase RayT